MHQYLDAQSRHRNVYKVSSAYGQFLRFKRIGSREEKLNNHLELLKKGLVKRGCKEDRSDSDTERTKLLEKTTSFQIRNKKN